MHIRIVFCDECIVQHKPEQQEVLKEGIVCTYNKNTLIVDVFRGILKQSNLLFPQIEMERKENGKIEQRITGYCRIDDNMLFDLFRIARNGRAYTLWDTTIKVDKLLKYLKIDNILELYFECSFAGTGAFGFVDGIEYYYQSEERNHWGRPHVHVKYRGIKMSIDIINLCRLNKKKRKHEKPIVNELEKRAIECVRKHQRAFITGWNDHTNGILVDISRYIDEEPWSKVG